MSGAVGHPDAGDVERLVPNGGLVRPRRELPLVVSPLLPTVTDAVEPSDSGPVRASVSGPD